MFPLARKEIINMYENYHFETLQPCIPFS